MNKHGNYTAHLYNMCDKVIPKEGGYVFCSVIAQRLKTLDTTLYRRWFQLTQFTLNTKMIYGIAALPCNKSEQCLPGHTTSLHIEFHMEPGKDYIES